jgi:hypothetical protein
VLRRDALLAAAVTAGLARRSGDAGAVATAWHRVSPVVAGADVEPLLLDVWGELSVVAEQVAPADRDVVVDAMHAAVVRADSPWWAVAAEQWWRLERAVVAGDAGQAADAADRLADAAGAHPGVRSRADAAATWAGALAGRVCAASVGSTATHLAQNGLRWEAATPRQRAGCSARAAACGPRPAPRDARPRVGCRTASARWARWSSTG